MAQTNVASCVLSILSSFSSGLDVFKKFQKNQKRKKNRGKQDAETENREVQLAKSLRQGPEDIGREYRKSLQTLGDQFAVGDGIAQTSLAEILLKLNTGIVSIINTFLRKDKRSPHIDYESLTQLSERSRMDTCRTLQALCRRMLSMRLPPPTSGINARQSAAASQVSKRSGSTKSRQKGATNAKQHKVRNPMLARVVINGSPAPSRVAMVKPGQRKNKSTSNLSVSGKTDSSVRKVKSASLSSPNLEAISEKAPRPPAQRSQTVPDVQRPRTKQSTADIRGSSQPPAVDNLRATRSTPRLETIPDTSLSAGPRSPNTMSPSALPARRRKPTPTYYSTATASTHLGEIPLHKWAEPYDFDAMSTLNREAVQNGWPLTEYAHVEERKKRRGLFGMFRRNRGEA